MTTLHTEQAKAIMTKLEVKPSAIQIEVELSFLLRNGMKPETNFDGLRGINLLKALSAERNKLIDSTRYDSYQAFKSDFDVNPYAALERLFIETFTDAKGRYLPNNLEALYELHVLNPYARFMSLINAL